MSGGYRRGGGPARAESHEDRIDDAPADSAPPVTTDWRGRGGWLAGARAERERDVAPGVEIGRRRRQMQDNAAHRDDDMDAQFEQSFAQPRHLGAGTRGARGPQPALLHEDIRGGRQGHGGLSGPEARAARTTD